MSSRKGPKLVDKSSASKLAIRRNTPNRRGDLNLTVRSNLSNNFSGSRERCNSTFCPTITTPAVPTIDWELQCDLAYSSYLQSLITTQIVEKTIKEHEMKVHDQLTVHNDVLLKQIEKMNHIEQEIEQFDLTPRLEELFNVLETTVDRTLGILSPDVEKKLDDLITSLDKCCNKLYLNNVKPFETQAEYDRFEVLLKRCIEVMRKINNVSGDVEDTQKLAACLNKYVELCDEVVKAENSVVQLQSEYGNLTLKTVSDMLAKFRGYEDDYFHCNS